MAFASCAAAIHEAANPRERHADHDRNSGDIPECPEGHVENPEQGNRSGDREKNSAVLSCAAATRVPYLLSMRPVVLPFHDDVKQSRSSKSGNQQDNSRSVYAEGIEADRTRSEISRDDSGSQPDVLHRRIAVNRDAAPREEDSAHDLLPDQHSGDAGNDGDVGQVEYRPPSEIDEIANCACAQHVDQVARCAADCGSHCDGHPW